MYEGGLVSTTYAQNSITRLNYNENKGTNMNQAYPD